MGKTISGTNGAFKIYPRGFLGTVQSPTIEKTTANDSSGMVGRMHFDVTMFDASKSTRITANMVIDSLYREFIRTGRANFEFREKVYIAALNAFGTYNFYNWYQVQYESPAFGNTNRRFLDDTFRFITSGRRSLPLQSWISLVKSDEQNTGEHFLGQYAASYFGVVKTNEAALYQNTLPEVLQSWLAKEGGFNDMLLTLFILFGVSD